VFISHLLFGWILAEQLVASFFFCGVLIIVKSYNIIGVKSTHELIVQANWQLHLETNILQGAPRRGFRDNPKSTDFHFTSPYGLLVT